MADDEKVYHQNLHNKRCTCSCYACQKATRNSQCCTVALAKRPKKR